MRRNGKTTRAIDNGIQMLFTHGIIRVPRTLRKELSLLELEENSETTILDPDRNANYGLLQNNVYQTIWQRLENEHSLIVSNKSVVKNVKRDYVEIKLC